MDLKLPKASYAETVTPVTGVPAVTVRISETSVPMVEKEKLASGPGSTVICMLAAGLL